MAAIVPLAGAEVAGVPARCRARPLGPGGCGISGAETGESTARKVAVTIGYRTEFFDPPRQKDISTQAVVSLRQMLTEAGYGAGAAHT